MKCSWLENELKSTFWTLYLHDNKRVFYLFSRGRISSSGQVKLAVFSTLYTFCFIILFIYEQIVSVLYLWHKSFLASTVHQHSDFWKLCNSHQLELEAAILLKTFIKTWVCSMTAFCHLLWQDRDCCRGSCFLAHAYVWVLGHKKYVR